MVWQLQNAKNKFSELVDTAIKDGPQEVTRRGKKSVVIMSYDDYQKIKNNNKPIVEFLREAPIQYLDLERTKDLAREVPL